MAEGGSSETDVNDHYHLYTVESKTPLSKTVRIINKNKYSKFVSKIFQQCDEKEFVRKGKEGQNGMVCSFQYKEKSVTITLYESTTTLRIQGKGCQQWFDGEFLKFEKQLRIENPHSTTSTASYQHDGQSQQIQQQPPYSQEPPISNVTSQPSDKQPGVSIKEFQTIFAVPKGTWPHTIILLYKYSSNASTKYQDIPENTWQRIDNDPKVKKRDYEGEHAESIMIKQLTEIQNHLKKQRDYERGSYNGIRTIDIILNYSPCNEDPHYCSTILCHFKDSLKKDIKAAEEAFNDTCASAIAACTEKVSKLTVKGKDEEVPKIKITFANFYKYYEAESIEGLKNLRRNGIELDVLTGDKWNDFYKAIGFELPAGREVHEYDVKVQFEKLAD